MVKSAKSLSRCAGSVLPFSSQSDRGDQVFVASLTAPGPGFCLVSVASSASSRTQSSHDSDSSRSDPATYSDHIRGRFSIKRWHARRIHDRKASNVLRPHQLNRQAHQSAIHDSDAPFVIYEPGFNAVLGHLPCLKLIATTAPELGGNGLALFHEAGVWLPQERAGSLVKNSGGDLWFTSNLLFSAPNSVEKEVSFRVEIGKVSVPAEESSSSQLSTEPDQLVESCDFPGVFVHQDYGYDNFDQTGLDIDHRIIMANGATAYGDQAILFCAQGQDRYMPEPFGPTQSQTSSSSRQGESNLMGSPLAAGLPGGLVLFEPLKPRGSQVTPILNNFHLRRFNSPNDVTTYPPQSRFVFFTDPDYGFEQGFKAKPMLPNSVWRLDQVTGEVCMMDDSLEKPNGICFDPSGTRCYVTDTDCINGGGCTDGSKAATIYVYDVQLAGGKPFLRAGRVFAFIDCGGPDGIKCDQSGNVYTGCFDGVNVFDSTGSLIGKIVLPRNLRSGIRSDIDSQNEPQRGCANLVFSPTYDQLFILSETTLWEVSFDKPSTTTPSPDLITTAQDPSQPGSNA